MNVHTKLFCIVVLFLFSFSFVAAQGEATDTITTAYRQYQDVSVSDIRVPTVVEVPLRGAFIERFDFAVLNQTTDTFEPHFFVQQKIAKPVSVFAEGATHSAERMSDDNVATYTEFPLPESTQGTARITVTSQVPITSSALTLLLDDHVALPSSIEIRARTESGERIVVAPQKMLQQSVRFPETTAAEWRITVTFGQQLRIAELRLVQEDATQASEQAIRFLAQPKHTYRIYLDPDRRVVLSLGEAGNLSADEDVLVLAPVSPQRNPGYVPADVDADGIPDVTDNCVSVANTDQEDIDGNGRGDVCDDFDKDGHINSEDNCPDEPNRWQEDTDGDAIGDVCDEEESRLTERYAWIPWVGIGLAALVLIVLLFLTTTSLRKGDVARGDGDQTHS